MTTHADPHDWFRRRLPAFVGGLLAETEERRFLEHRAECEECRRAFDEFTASDEIALTERGAHIPAPMLARWDQARRELTGIERAMVRVHLRRCAECRGDLERIGHTPELEFVRELEAEPIGRGWLDRLVRRPPQSGAARVAEPEPIADVRRPAAERFRPRRGWVPWALGGWAASATAALILVAVMAREPRDIGLQPGAGPTTVTAEPGAAPGLALEPLPAAVRLHTPKRSTRGRDVTEEVTTIPIGDERLVRLAIGPLDLPEGASVEAEVLEGDSVLAHRTLGTPVAAGVTVLFGDARAPLTPGDYLLRLTGRTRDGDPMARQDTVEFAFRLVR